ncbi:MAG: helix-turn-helix transcriptional regulator [Clostridia bacterium]|nr:helix-turn-helix transcriptional regulator [Clostridia bacterium]
MKIQDCNPYVRAAEIQPAVLEGEGLRKAYDHRLFYILEGEGVLILSNSVHTVGADCLLYFIPQTPYHFKGKLKVAVLNFDVTRACSDKTKPICPPPVAEFDERFLFDTQTVDGGYDTVIKNSNLRSDVLEIVHTFCKNEAYADAQTSAMLKKLLAEIFRPKIGSEEASDRLIERIKRHIKLYCSEIESNEDVAKAFGYHSVYLATLFKTRTGETLHKAILSERIKLACRWLEKTDLSIEEIAYNVGFSTRNHFCTAFKKFTGISPLVYRKKILQLEQ